MVPSSPTFVRFPLRPNPAREWLEKKRKQDGSPAATPPPAPSGKTLDLALLLSCLPERYYRWLMAALPPFAAKTPPLHPLRGLADAPRAGFPPLLFRRRRLHWLRMRLVAELAFGLSITATPLWQLNRPRRSQALMERAAIIWQLVETLRCCPGADAPEQELERALARLRR